MLEVLVERNDFFVTEESACIAPELKDMGYSKPFYHHSIDLSKRDNFGLHYFYGSPTAVQIYAVVTAAIISRRFWLLHGITIIFVRKILDVLYAWGIYFAASSELKELKQLNFWLINCWLQQAEKAIQGDTLRQALVGSAVKVWNSFGRSLFYQVWRAHLRDVNAAILRETKELIARTDNIRQSGAGLFSLCFANELLASSEESLRKKGRELVHLSEALLSN